MNHPKKGLPDITSRPPAPGMGRPADEAVELNWGESHERQYN